MYTRSAGAGCLGTWNTKGDTPLVRAQRKGSAVGLAEAVGALGCGCNAQRAVVHGRALW